MPATLGPGPEVNRYPWRRVIDTAGRGPAPSDDVSEVGFSPRRMPRCDFNQRPAHDRRRQNRLPTTPCSLHMHSPRPRFLRQLRYSGRSLSEAAIGYDV